MLENDWIWYPNKECVFWLETELIEALNEYSISTSEKELLQSGYCKKYTSLGSSPHLEQLRSAIRLWDNIKKNGFEKDIDAFRMNITAEGRLEVIDGFHRLIILDYLNYDGKIKIEICEEHKKWLGFKEKIKKLGNMYSPVYHPDLQNLTFYRTDSQERLNYIYSEIEMVDNIIDIGACEGFFCFGLQGKAKKHVYGIEENKLRWEISNYLNRLYDRGTDKILFYNDNFVEFLQSNTIHFNVGIFLSTFHHLLIHYDGNAWDLLKNLSEKIDTLFFSTAVKGDDVWTDHPNLSALKTEDIPKLVNQYWGYNKYKVLPIKTNNDRTIFKLWRENHENAIYC